MHQASFTLIPLCHLVSSWPFSVCLLLAGSGSAAWPEFPGRFSLRSKHILFKQILLDSCFFFPGGFCCLCLCGCRMRPYWTKSVSVACVFRRSFMAGIAVSAPMQTTNLRICSRNGGRQWKIERMSAPLLLIPEPSEVIEEEPSTQPRRTARPNPKVSGLQWTV